jgi:hypothetical protein
LSPEKQKGERERAARRRWETIEGSGQTRRQACDNQADPAQDQLDPDIHGDPPMVGTSMMNHRLQEKG